MIKLKIQLKNYFKLCLASTLPSFLATRFKLMTTTWTPPPTTTPSLRSLCLRTIAVNCESLTSLDVISERSVVEVRPPSAVTLRDGALAQSTSKLHTHTLIHTHTHSLSLQSASSPSPKILALILARQALSPFTARLIWNTGHTSIRTFLRKNLAPEALKLATEARFSDNPHVMMMS